ncbi:hypothetical protein [Methanolapillus millepedarum]|uniref:Uncharacterized protein n=1 Tax=Methanolapillus millepedarum TaxID=3028296 RepID=A0AA96V598_9EURY|nr:hypothetical protein MsAc7_17430 [Methanosarcinaceae archaeon Ac7]
MGSDIVIFMCKKCKDEIWATEDEVIRWAKKGLGALCLDCESYSCVPKTKKDEAKAKEYTKLTEKRGVEIK